jgi:hypothetical protein
LPITRRRLSCSLLASILALLAGPRSSYGDDAGSEAIRIEFEAPAQCSDENAFVSQLRARTQRAHIVTAGEQERRAFHLTITASGDAYDGRLLIRSGDRQASREVTGATCDEVLNALALVAALAIDPHASTADIAPASAPGPAPEPAPPPTPPPTPVASEPKPPAPEKTSREEGTWRVAVGATGGARAGSLPSLSPDGAVFAALSKDRGAFAPEIRLAYVQALSQTLAPGAGTVAFDFGTARLEACPVRVRWKDVSVIPCATLEVGSTSASAAGVENPESTHRGWYAGGAVARVEWEVTKRVVLEASADVLVPFRHDRFYFGPDNLTVYETPSLGAAASLGVAFVAFP